MGYYCTVPQCTSLAGKTKNVKFHRFPRDVTMADKWNIILKRGKPYTKYSKVCSLHFTQADYNVTAMGQWKTLSKDAVPSQNLPKLNPDGTVMVIRKSRTVKYKEARKDDSISEKTEKWCLNSQTTMAMNSTPERILHTNENSDSNLVYRLQALNAIANNISPQQNNDNHGQNSHVPSLRPKKQDAFMQTDPIQSEEEETKPNNNSYSESSEKSFSSDQLDTYTVPITYQKEAEGYDQLKKYDLPKDYTKTNDDYIPQTNEEYNKEAEKYALERKSLNGYEKPAVDVIYQKPIIENGYQKIPEIYAYNDKQQEYENRNDNYIGYTNGYPDSAEILKNQQHNLQLLQEPHRITENQNFFNESHIKQEIDFGTEDDKFLYERTKDPLDPNSLYNEDQRRLEQQRLLEHLQHQVKEEPDVNNGCDTVMQPQGSPYYQTDAQNVTTGVSGYYEQISRPGPELLIAKQNALAAHTQLWQNTMKRPFFYSESSPYTGPQVLHRYEDITRILQ
ncbi:unnamed protein product [Parnassius mnemosyne]|uniref:THAP-type domain-containing protein n=1 Tax=Parnassius mnemosyne TaxID=213953 RepID=A0AAV1LBV1_9NEOP